MDFSDYEYALELQKNEKYEDAIAKFKKVFNWCINHPFPVNIPFHDIIMHMGFCYQGLGHVEEAIESFEGYLNAFDSEVLHSHRAFSEIMANLALLYQEDDQLEKSLSLLEEACIWFENQSAITRYNLLDEKYEFELDVDTVYHEDINHEEIQKEYDEAVANLDKELLEEEYDLALLYLQLAVGYEECENYYDAIEYYDAAIEMFYDALVDGCKDRMCVEDNLNSLEQRLQVLKDMPKENVCL